MQFDRFALDDAEGAVLAHGVKAGDVVLRKGRRLTQPSDLEPPAQAGVAIVVAARFGRDDVPEDEAAARLAALAAGEAVETAAGIHRPRQSARGGPRPAAGRSRPDRPLQPRSTRRSRSPRCRQHAVVEPRQMVATVKIIPFADPRPSCSSAAARRWPARSARCGWRPFRPWRARLIQTELPSLAAEGAGQDRADHPRPRCADGGGRAGRRDALPRTTRRRWPRPIRDGAWRPAATCC